LKNNKIYVTKKLYSLKDINLNKNKNLHISFFLTAIIVLMYIMFLISGEAFAKLFILKSSDITLILPWQFVTYALLFNSHPIFFFFAILLFFSFSNVLEDLWGSFHFLIYVIIIILSKSISSFLFGPLPIYGSESLYLCIMVAFGFNYPQERIFLFGIIPIRVKTLAIISMAIAPIGIIVTLFYTVNKSIDAGGLIPLNLWQSVIITGIFSYIAILIYFKKIFGKPKIIEVVNNKIKNAKEEIDKEIKEKENKKYLDIYNKIKEGQKLTKEEEELFSVIKSNDAHLCDIIDFDEKDTYCIICDKYGHCIKRKVEL